MPINDRGLELDFIIALHKACKRADNKIKIKIEFIDNILLHSCYCYTFCESFLSNNESHN